MKAKSDRPIQKQCMCFFFNDVPIFNDAGPGSASGRVPRHQFAAQQVVDVVLHVQHVVFHKELQ